MFLKNEIQKRVQVVLNPELSSEKRVFAALELLCAPLSFCAIFIFLPTLAVMDQCSVFSPGVSQGLNQILRVLLSAAVGYLTNYIALEMLFKPFRPTWRHPLTLLTLGYWRQGLVPKNKNRLGAEIGQQVEKKLLNPEEISNELCEMTVDFLQNPETVRKTREQIQKMFQEHHERIAEFMVPQLEESLLQSLNQILTLENMKSFWAEIIEPRLTSSETRQKIAEKVAEGLKSRAPQFMETLKEMVREYVHSFLNKNPLLGSFGLANGLADGFVAFVNWKDVEEKIEKKLSDPETIASLGNELAGLGTLFQSWMDSPESTNQFEDFRTDIQGKLREFLTSYLKTGLPQWLEKMQDSPQIWAWVETDALPGVKQYIESWIQTNGKDLVIEKLRLSERVQTAVEKQDVEEFYNMINSVAAEHFGAIQVLGFFIGGLVGFVQLWL